MEISLTEVCVCVLTIILLFENLSKFLGDQRHSSLMLNGPLSKQCIPIKVNMCILIVSHCVHVFYVHIHGLLRLRLPTRVLTYALAFLSRRGLC